MPEQPAPKRFPDRDEIAAVRAEAEPLEAGAEADSTRRIAGRAMARRGMGKLVFLDVVDRSGRIQAICDVAVTGELDVHVGDVVGVVGRPAKSRRGEPSVLAESVEVLSRNTQPLPDTFHGLTDVELRYRKRYLDLLMNEETREVFVTRARVITAVRRALDEEGFVEVETPVLQPRYGGAFARPFVTHHNELDADLYLRIATELYLKRLIVGGLERVYEIGKDFRNEGVSFKHNPEFTMLEWYEAYADYGDTMARIERLVERVAREVLGTTAVSFRGHEIDLAGPWERIRFVEALERHELWTRDPAELRAWLTERGVDTDADKDWTQLVDHAFSHYVEPGLIQPTIVHDYPVELSPFARPTDDDPTLTERFEYFAGGMELGNAFTEINEAAMQQARFEQQSEQVEGERGDPDYVEALSYGMPPTGGLGFGIDRFVMLLTGQGVDPGRRAVPGAPARAGHGLSPASGVPRTRGRPPACAGTIRTAWRRTEPIPASFPCRPPPQDDRFRRGARERRPPRHTRRGRDDRPPRAGARVQPGCGAALRLPAGGRPRAGARRAHRPRREQGRPSARPRPLGRRSAGGGHRLDARQTDRGHGAECQGRGVPRRARDHAARAARAADLHRLHPRPRRPQAERGSRAGGRGALPGARRAASARRVRRRDRRRELEHLLEPAGRGDARVLARRVEA